MSTYTQFVCSWPSDLIETDRRKRLEHWPWFSRIIFLFYAILCPVTGRLISLLSIHHELLDDDRVSIIIEQVAHNFFRRRKWSKFLETRMVQTRNLCICFISSHEWTEELLLRNSQNVWLFAITSVVEGGEDCPSSFFSSNIISNQRHSFSHRKAYRRKKSILGV